ERPGPAVRHHRRPGRTHGGLEPGRKNRRPCIDVPGRHLHVGCQPGRPARHVGALRLWPGRQHPASGWHANHWQLFRRRSAVACGQRLSTGHRLASAPSGAAGMNWEIVIGLETHTQLSTASKIFSGSRTAFGAAANTQANAVDLALPGTLPVMNRGAVERAIRVGLAVGATVAPRSIFARKNYFYPDLPKNYQISQYEIPVVQGGSISFFVGDTEKTINLTRAHLEEDAGKSLHDDFTGPHGERSSGIDLNRTGTPLLEIVSEPEMRSADEAVAYAKALHALVVWLGICDGNMQEGS